VAEVGVVEVKVKGGGERGKVVVVGSVEAGEPSRKI
jgi:hypothetical protein